MSRTVSSLRQDKGNKEDNEKSTKKRFKRLKKAFADPFTEVYISFFMSAPPLFTHYNLFLQRSDPQAHHVYPMTQSLIKKIASRFLKREAVSNVTVKNVQDESNYVPLKDMYVGFNTMLLLRRLFNEGDIDQAQSDKFLLSAQSF